MNSKAKRTNTKPPLQMCFIFFLAVKVVVEIAINNSKNRLFKGNVDKDFKEYVKNHVSIRNKMEIYDISIRWYSHLKDFYFGWSKQFSVANFR